MKDKKINKYTEELENFLAFLTEDELMDWLEKNCFDVKNLLELIMKEKENVFVTV